MSIREILADYRRNYAPVFPGDPSAEKAKANHDKVDSATEHAIAALTAYVEERERQARIDELEEVRKHPVFHISENGSTSYTEDRIAELQKGKPSQDKGTATKEEL